MKMRKAPKKKGQTSVEYLLLMGAAVFAVVAFKKALIDGMFTKVVPETVGSVRGEAGTGGRKPAYYYLKSRATE